MKAKIWLTALAWLALGLALQKNAGATLIDRGAFVYDDSSAVSWAKNAGSTGWHSWDQQDLWADGLVLAGFVDWRLPTVTEFTALATQLPDYPGLFIDIGADYWTADNGFLGEEYARVWDWHDGRDYGALKGVPYLGWAVRDGDGGVISGRFAFDSRPVSVPEPSPLMLGLIALAVRLVAWRLR